jgi:hypothetical protein
MGNKILKRVMFIDKFIAAFEDESSIVFILDEMGIGRLFLYPTFNIQRFKSVKEICLFSYRYSSNP